MDEMKLDEFNERVALLDEEERDHLKRLITALVRCYTSDDMQGILITGNNTTARASVMTINCNEMDASGMLAVAVDFFDAVNTIDAPPKEMFN